MVYKVAVIGCGLIGQRLGQAFVDHKMTNLVSAVDINSEVLEIYCSRFSCQGFSDYRDVLRTDVDIIYVGVPPKWHTVITLDALQAGKHVICEKPIAISAEQG